METTLFAWTALPDSGGAFHFVFLPPLQEMGLCVGQQVAARI